MNANHTLYKSFLKSHWQNFSRHYVPSIVGKSPEKFKRLKPTFYKNFRACFNAVQSNKCILQTLHSNLIWHPSKGVSYRYLKTSAAALIQNKIQTRNQMMKVEIIESI
ncbi:uncharacterized protein TNCT_134501 [Trichonephila clavata]|uniref:Uncharacterized protein n=1 Tax=Trichonephila clavata TaxID=2740835 RepID=A0A8X6FTG9_TRICU|nr:uncharacterized protein TNCT_134501 [Trichonephila clavata]